MRAFAVRPGGPGRPSGGDGGGGGRRLAGADRNVAPCWPSATPPPGPPTASTAPATTATGPGHDLDVKIPVGTVVLDHGDRVAAGGLVGPRSAGWRPGPARAAGATPASCPTAGGSGLRRAGDSRSAGCAWSSAAGDVAIVGFPNAGKSTYISRVSAARPKIADYPFTTLEPNLGVARIDDDLEIVLADVPGLIEGASEGRGLGHRFLRHVERARVLLVLIDLCELAEREPDQQLAVLLRSWALPGPELLERPRWWWAAGRHRAGRVVRLRGAGCPRPPAGRGRGARRAGPDGGGGQGRRAASTGRRSCTAPCRPRRGEGRAGRASWTVTGGPRPGRWPQRHDRPGALS